MITRFAMSFPVSHERRENYALKVGAGYKAEGGKEQGAVGGIEARGFLTGSLARGERVCAGAMTVDRGRTKNRQAVKPAGIHLFKHACLFFCYLPGTRFTGRFPWY